jgi:hypothetical protein
MWPSSVIPPSGVLIASSSLTFQDLDIIGIVDFSAKIDIRGHSGKQHVADLIEVDV